VRVPSSTPEPKENIGELRFDDVEELKPRHRAVRTSTC
jgi:hypothetical protein